MKKVAVFLAATTLWACTDSGGQRVDKGSLVTRKDGFIKKHPDGYRALPDGYVLQNCTEVGKACNAHDPCAISPICTADKKCMPSSLMNCDDGLPCTKDSCGGAGLCVNTPVKGYCKLAVKVKPGQTCKTIKQSTPDIGVPDAGVSDAGAADARVGDGGATDGGAGDGGTGTKTIVCCFTQGERNPNDNKGGPASSHVVNTKGTVLYTHWNAMFTSSGWNKVNQIYSFNGTLVDEGYGKPTWANADGWHGSNTNGTVRTGFTCKDWTDSTSSSIGAAGELDDGLWIGGVLKPCSGYQAVVCVQAAP